ncbi:histidinol-phosphate transaminase [Pontimonas sp.]|uniref:histidinol-phosphate transaminase n=1 Tax=Pontimonas sp. TaxID=2304492 RepID=UPI002870A0B0|nr:histidinol-phosphate transaminase [Pontimonas sp.]MDR9396585.1 histidinol-phosphate transaminase [Pontimonas sp.]
MELSDLPIRDDLRGKSPYGAPMVDVPVTLNVNENTHRVPDAVRSSILEALSDALENINRYPDREFLALREGLAAYLAQRPTGESTTGGPESIWAANGSNEVLQHVLQAFGGPGRSVLGFPPTYSMHPIIAEATGTRWVPAQRDADFEISPATAVAAVTEHQPDVVFFCSPNNPTGTGVSLETIEATYDASEAMVLVDEAYIEFAPDDHLSARRLLAGRPRLMISRTMSKAFAFAGARLGYLIADPVVNDALRLVRLPYHLSALTQAAATAALAHHETMLATVESIRQQRDRLARELTAMGYFVWPSLANFVLFGGVVDPGETFRGLLEQGVLVRDVGIEHTLRVSAGTAEETSAFLEALTRLER